jgi:hypothetical protein
LDGGASLYKREEKTNSPFIKGGWRGITDALIKKDPRSRLDRIEGLLFGLVCLTIKVLLDHF